MFRMGVSEWVVILLIVLIVVGPTQIPKLIKLFKDSTQGASAEESGDK